MMWVFWTHCDARVNYIKKIVRVGPSPILILLHIPCHLSSQVCKHRLLHVPLWRGKILIYTPGYCYREVQIYSRKGRVGPLNQALCSDSTVAQPGVVHACTLGG